MRTTKLLIAAGALILLAAAVPVSATEELAEAEALQCTACHDKPGSKLMTGQGKYYEVVRTVEGYEEVTRVFGECTTCHKRKPGSTKLTVTGKQFAEIIGDMEGLKELLLMEHPAPPAEAVDSESVDDPKAGNVDAEDDESHADPINLDREGGQDP